MTLSHTPTKLGAFTVGLLLAFGGAFAVGRAAGPDAPVAPDSRDARTATVTEEMHQP